MAAPPMKGTHDREDPDEHSSQHGTEPSVSAGRHGGLTEQAAAAAVDQACRMLRLPTIRSQFPDIADAAAKDQMSYRAFLAELLLAECDDRARRRSERRIKGAGFPPD